MTTITLRYKEAKSGSGAEILPSLNIKLWYAFLALSLLFMAGWYIFLVNQLTLGAHLVKNYNKEISTLEAQNRELEISLAKTDFMGQMHQKAESLGFEKTAKVEYVHLIDKSFAVK